MDHPADITITVNGAARKAAPEAGQSLVAVAPAIANAVFGAAGIRLRSLPLAPCGSVRG